MYKITKNNKELKQGTLKEVMYYFLSIESNIYYALASKGYKILKDNEIIQLTSDEQNHFEYDYKKDLHIKRVNKIKEIIKELNFVITQENNIKEHGYQPNNINIYAKNQNDEGLRFSMCYNNKNKITLSAYWKRTKNYKYINMPDISISFSCDKDLKKIINDINNRFIPNWEDLKKEYYKKVNDIENSFDLTIANMELLKGEKLTESEKKGNTIYPKNENIQKIDVYQDSIRIHLYSMPIVKALKVIDVLTNKKNM